MARAINVSQSSVKCWRDKGVIRTQYTAGGHRRIAMPDLIEFLRAGKYVLVHPEALGLPPTRGQTIRVVDRAPDQMTEALLAGRDVTCRSNATGGSRNNQQPQFAADVGWCVVVYPKDGFAALGSGIR